MDTITVLGTKIVVPQVWDSEDDIVISLMRMGEIVSKYKTSLEISAGYMAKDDMDLPLTKEEEDICEKQIDVRMGLRVLMVDARERARKSLLILKERNR